MRHRCCRRGAGKNPSLVPSTRFARSGQANNGRRSLAKVAPLVQAAEVRCQYMETTQTIAIFFALFVGVGLTVRRLLVSRKAQEWPSVEGTIESGQMEQVAGGGKTPRVILPVFAFSYHVEGQYYGGRFALLPYNTDPTVDDPSFLEHMVGRKVQVNYNPEHPEVWFVADKLIEGCRVEQKFGRDLTNFAPSDQGP